MGEVNVKIAARPPDGVDRLLMDLQTFLVWP